MKNNSNLFKTYIRLWILVLVAFTFSINAQSRNNFDPDTVKAGKFDNGKMWTFDYPPFEYLKNTYDFEPSQDWFDNVRLSALRIPGCTASFVSADGLIMTNHHCSERNRDMAQKEGEDFKKNGFYARTLDDERKLPGFYAEQLVFIKDVTNEVMDAFNSGSNEKDKIDTRDKKINELEKQYSDETGLKCHVVSYYNGGKYSLQGFRRYDDIRLVFIPEERIGYFGGDYDNFTYPRYNLDCTFYRIYGDDGKPLRTEHYFHWSKGGALPGEVIFSVGNPGTTNRLKTVAQLEYYRDVSYRNYAFLFDEYYKKLEELKAKYPDRAKEFEGMRTDIGNGQKVLTNIEQGLLDPYLIARKKAFEDKLKATVKADPELQKEYGHVWEAIERTRAELKKYDTKIAAYNPKIRFGSAYFPLAANIVEYAEQMKLPEEKREIPFQKDNLEATIQNIFPADFDKVLEDARLSIQINYIILNLGKDDELVKTLFQGKNGDEAAQLLLSKSEINTKDKVVELLQKSPDEILNSNDPFIYYIVHTKDELKKLEALSEEVNKTEDVSENLLGEVIFKIYGTTIPPDANRTLRIGDGVMKSFDYNGTIAPLKTTFYGLYDRWYSYDKEYPWDLPKRWEKPSPDFDLSTPFNEISTNDIVGGSSGSAVINKNAEIVGLAFDGNISSIIGNFIYMPENNRMVFVASQAMVEALKHMYNAAPLAEELETGEIQK